MKGEAVTVQLPKIDAAEPRLSPDSFNQNSTDSSFQNFLEEEQKRLALFFNASGQFNFDSWFQYSSFDAQPQGSVYKADLFSDIDSRSQENKNPDASNQPAKTGNESPAGNLFSQIAGNYFSKPNQTQIQDLLLKTGWLTPNLEAFPALFKAQLDGKLLNKLDLQFLVDQLVSQLEIVKGKGKTDLTLGLKPENLGEILLTLTSKSGMISIQIQAPEETKKLIEAELKLLEMALKRAKVNLAEIKVSAIKEAGKNA
ncbi:MAG: flagellar hook-length control protein FliK [Candidatus Margulisbacteria bacterium]|nr:flagellar hook-length control protein FliK [Candidatus Margulisiibacteriota bacterium]